MQINKTAPSNQGGSSSGLRSGFFKTDNTGDYTQKQDSLQIDNFLSAFFPDEQEPINLRLLGCKTLENKPLPKHLQIGAKTVLSSRFQLKHGGFHLQGLQGANEQQGVYFVVNAGGNSDKDITRFNAFFVENDTLPINEQHKRLDASPLKPSIRIETAKSVHAYWLHNGACTAQEWCEMQKRLIQYFDGDTAIHNPARVMRLPFFNHVRYDENAAKYIYKPIELKVFEPARRHTLQEMRAAFPPVQNGRAAIQNVQKLNSLFLSGRDDYSQNKHEAQELANKCLQYLSPERCENRESWIKVGYALRNTFEGSESGLVLWREWSKKCPEKYQEGCCEDVWNGTERETGEKLTIGSLIFWACEDSADFRQFWKEQNEVATAPEKTTQASRLLASVMPNVELFHTAEGECYADVKNKGHHETLKLSSRAFKDWLSYEFYRQESKTPNAQAISDVIQTLAGKARFDSPQIEVFLRVAEKDGAIYVDLCDEAWRVVEITKNGWRVLNQSPVKFRRTKGMFPLPDPTRGGSLTALKNLINVSDADFVLVLAWLVSCFCFNKPYPVLVLHGEQGSAKSTTSKVLRRMIDPNKADLREKPKDSRDLMIAANNGYVIVYDNLSNLSPEMSDALCRLATGGGFSTRELYSNDEETIFDVKRPLILNGIEETASRSDLLDRALLIECPRITEQSRKTETEFENAFVSEHGKLLGALFDAVAHALKELPNVRLDWMPRMADFARWACAAEPAFGLQGNAFLERYQNNRETAHAVTLESSPVGKAIVSFMHGKTAWQGTVEDLRGSLISGFDNNLTGFPKNARSLGGMLKRLAPTLRANGVEFADAPRKKNAREITLTRQI
jgi:hypothetical protein